jgi:hypothetical protein
VSQQITGISAGTYTLQSTTQGTISPATDTRTLTATTVDGKLEQPALDHLIWRVPHCDVPDVVVGADAIITVGAAWPAKGRPASWRWVLPVMGGCPMMWSSRELASFGGQSGLTSRLLKCSSDVDKCGQKTFSQRTVDAQVPAKVPEIPGVLVVAPTGVDPVTSRFSVVRSTN